jgi:NAD(P)-dependent dehydrogenase (short-subunit alcohol dehydrogenase family)
MCKAALERFTTGLAAEASNDNIGVNVISPGLIATPGVLHHGLVNESNKDMAVPVENMAEACLFLVHGDPSVNSGKITYAADVLRDEKLAVSELLA